MKFLPFFSFLNDWLRLMSHHQQFPVECVNCDGGRKSGKSDNWALFLAKAMSIIDPETGEYIKASAVIVKKQANTLTEVFSEYSKIALEEIYIPTVIKTKFVLEYENGNYIKFKSWINKNGQQAYKQGAGWSSADGEYVFVVVEEAYELSPQDRQDISEAFRKSNNNAKVLFVYICNPWYPNNPYIKFLDYHLPYNKLELRNKGYQYVIKEVNELKDHGFESEDYTPEKHLFIHTNWRINPYLTKTDINGILRAKILKPQEADTADYGIPGYGESSVYGSLMFTIKQAVWEPKEVIFAGGDEGLGTTTNSKTAFVFGGYNYNGYLDVWANYEWNNTVQLKSPGQLAKEIVDFYIMCREQYYLKVGTWIDAIQVIVDKSAIAFISALNSEAFNRQIDWLEFIPCQKYEIRDRVAIFNFLLSNYKFRASCPALIKEMSNAVWDTTKATVKPRRKDKDDHTINALEYAIEPFMYHVFDNDSLASQLSQRGKKQI